MPDLSLKVPPLAVFALAAAAVLFLGWLLPAWHWAEWVRALLASLLAVSGVLIGVLGVVEFRRASTTLHPMHPERASSLVVSGVYRLTRNPMYLGMLLVLAALVLMLGQPWAVLVLAAFVIYLNRFQISAEEQAMASLFGEQYSDYCHRVRPWI